MEADKLLHFEATIQYRQSGLPVFLSNLTAQAGARNFAPPMAKHRKNAPPPIFGDWDFERTNYLIFGAGIVLIFLAYVIMALGETNSFQALTLAPTLLVIGYLVIIPLAILYRPRKR